MWILRLNPMQDNSEQCVAVARAEEREALEAFLARERVEPYEEAGFNLLLQQPTTWRKVFRKDGPLEWYNPPEWSLAFFEPFVHVMSLDEAVAFTRCEWQRTVGSIPVV